MMDDKASVEEPTDHPHHTRRRFLKQAALAATGVCVGAVPPRTGNAVTPVPETKCANINTPMKEVEGKVAFITGGSSGIGLGVALVCADAGMKVVISYRTKRNVDRAMAQLSSAGNRVHAIAVDVTDRAGMERAAAEAVKVFGKIHLLVNNAGVTVRASLSESTYDDWDWVMGVNLTGVFNGLRAFVPHIKAHGEGGQVVTTSSVVGLVVYGGQGIYSTSKFAAIGMMEALRSELASTNIGASVFCPGFVASDLMDASRNRPNVYSETSSDPLQSQQRAHVRAITKNATTGPEVMNPIEAGRLMLRGIRNNDLYILSHPEFEQGIRDRNEALIASIPNDLHPPKERVSAEHDFLRNTIYTAQRDRNRCSK